MSLVAGEAGVSGKSGRSRLSSSSSSSCLGGAPSAAEGADPGCVHEWQVCTILRNSLSCSSKLLLRGLGLTKWPDCLRPEMMGGGLSGRGALAGVVGGEVEKVLTITLVALVPSVPDVRSIKKLETVTWAPGVWGRG